jgi:peptide/nickel transport system permease protein
VGQGVPSFWLGLILVLIFAVELRWLPSAGDSGTSSLILPAITLASFSLASVTRLTRSSMLDVLDSEYVKLARAKGMPERSVILKHALRNAAVPLITILGLQLAVLLRGAVLTETIFNWPGLGQLSISAIFASDYPVVQCIVLLGAAVFVGINLAIDLLYAVIDPRIRYA